MGDSKKPEANIEAIYRLEFYKKQKNWKLSKDNKNKKCDQGEVIRNRVNETYDVLEPKTKVCELNDFSKEGYGVPSTSNCQPSYTSKPVTPDYPAYNCQNAFPPQHGIWKYNLQDHIQSKANKPHTESNYWSGGKNWSQEIFDSYRIKQEHLNFNISSEKPQGRLDINKNENHVLQSDQASPQGVPSTSNCQPSYTSKPVTPDYPAYNCQNAFPPQHGIWKYNLQDHIQSKANKPHTESNYWSGGKNWSQEIFDSYRIKQEHLNFNISSEKPQGRLDINKNENHVLQSDQASPQDWPNYTNALKWYDELTLEDTPVPPNVCSRFPEGMHSNAEVECDSISQVPANSWNEFERGAHVARYSGQRGLSNVLTESAVAQLSLARSSSDNIPKQAIVLWYLQLEEIRLQHLYSPFSSTPRTNTSHAGTASISFEEFLTRNFNTSARQTAFNCETPHHEMPSTTNDLFVVGRSRGRLQMATGIDNYKNIEGVKGSRRPFRL